MSLADRYRAHRRAFELALELGCTPAEARAEIERREARERWAAIYARLTVKMAGPVHDPAPRDEPWMMRG